MDEDEAFLYGDDEVTTEPKNGVTQSSSEAPAPVFKPTFEAVSRISATPELPEKPLADEPSSIPPLFTPIADIEQDVPNPFLNTAKSTQDNPSDLESNGEHEMNQGHEDDDDQELEEEDSDDDLHIILEGDGTHLHSAPNARASVSTSRPEIPRESPVQARAIDPANATTEYKILERIEGKPADLSTPGPTKPTPSLSHNQYRNPYELPTHNRLPTPENFPRPATPPHDSSLGDQQPPINSEAPVPLTGYDDKDGTTLMNFDFDAIPDSEKGWKKPGAHVADWFNYGFDETTWRWYVMKQKRHRADESWAANPFAAFATGNIQEAWDALPSELKGVMMQTIMGPNAGTNGNHGPQMPPPPMPQMMVMNPMMQGMDMGGFGIQGMPGMPGMMGNGHMNGTHHNGGMINQHNEGPSRGVKQDPTGVSEAGGETPGLYADGLDPREQQHQHHEQQRMQDQMRHMQHMQNMGMGPGFMPGMDLAAMFGNQEMYMNPGQFNGMMEMPQMPQMPQMQHMNPQMQQQMGGNSGMDMGMSQGMSPGVTAGPMNAGLVPNKSQPPTTTSPAVPTSALPPASAPPSASSVSAAAPGPGPTPGPVPGSAAGPAGLISTPVGSPGSSMNMQSPLTAGRGRGRGGRGRGNPPASAFLAAAAARGRGRVLSSNGPSVAPPSTVPPVTTPIVTPPQISSIPDTVSTPNAIPVAEPSPERSTRAISPLPSNVPTGPRKAALPNPAPARPIRVTPVGYFDKDAAGARGDEGLDYGGGSAESPHEERKMSLPISRRHGHRSDREKLEEDPRERPENYSERSRSKSRDKELDEKDSTSGTHRKSRHRHRGRSRSKESDHRSSREKSEKDKEEGLNHKSSRGSGRRSRRSKRTTETDEKDDARDGPSDERDRDRDKDKGKERDRDRDKDREKQKDRDRDKSKDGDKDKVKDEMKDKEHDKDKERERERDEGTDAGAEHGTSGSSRKRKSTKEDRGSRSSKRERAE